MCCGHDKRMCKTFATCQSFDGQMCACLNIQSNIHGYGDTTNVMSIVEYAILSRGLVQSVTSLLRG